uniref:pyridoxal phosphate-dependent aminotransferase n=1 Tax=Vaginimicrobium propionicum TaxID=1871034 RepID=UPI001E4779B7|nr:pyridoxal phosphate-dependent aminotransferase [Vaginimicrobium propionicum]
MRFSNRVVVSELNRIAHAERAAESAGTLIRLSDSNPTRHCLAPRLLPDEYQADPRGSLAARRQLADWLSGRYGREVDPDNLYLLNSTSQGYAWAMKLFCCAGDKLLAPRPGYPLIDHLARLEEVEVENYFLTFDGAWLVDIGHLKELLASGDERIRGLVAINPNNPTGSYLRPEERGAIIELCSQYELPLIVDEVFFYFPLGVDSRRRLSGEGLSGNSLGVVERRRLAGEGLCGAPAIAGERRRLAGESSVLTLALDGLSKNLAAPHAKVAWLEVSGPHVLVDEAKARLDVIADAYLPVSQLMVDQLPHMLSQVDEQQRRVSERTRHNLDTLTSLVCASSSGVMDVYPPEGGWSALIRFPATIDEDGLVLELINHHGITVQPGYFFDLPTPGFLSVSLLLDPKVFADAVTQLVKTVDALAG